MSAREAAIRERAYLIWEQQGRPHGCDQEHWIEAERQIAVEAVAVIAEVEVPAAKPEKRAAAPRKAADVKAKAAEAPVVEAAALKPKRKPARPAVRH